MLKNKMTQHYSTENYPIHLDRHTHSFVISSYNATTKKHFSKPTGLLVLQLAVYNNNLAMILVIQKLIRSKHKI